MFIPCRKCSNKNGPKPGFYYSSVDNFGVVKECECHINWRRSEDIRRKSLAANVATDLSFSDYKGTTSVEDMRCLEKISKDPQKFIDRGSMVYLYGPNGTQKTSMVKVLGKKLLEQDNTVFYTRMNDLIQVLLDIRGFDEDSAATAQNTYRKLLEADFIFVDESFDRSKVTVFKSGYQIPYLDNFIRERYECGRKPILFISNVKPLDIDENLFGKSLKDLIIRSTRGSYLEFWDKYSMSSVNISRTALFD